jgi:hypothetical protein
MEKEFIPYEQALALKDLGFDEECLAGYDIDTNELFIGYEYNQQTFNDDFYIKAPLYQQAFRWFSENYKLRGLIEIGTQEYSFLIFDEKTDSRCITSSMNGTYQEAELACLKKLIEIVKNKQ